MVANHDHRNLFTLYITCSQHHIHYTRTNAYKQIQAYIQHVINQKDIFL